MLVNGELQQSYFWRGLGNRQNIIESDITTLGYPVFHYGTLICHISAPPGTLIRNVTIRNLDGQLSVNARDYRVAASMADLDSDGDGLADEWETRGVDVDHDDTLDIDFPALGANPLRKDIFLEVDWMAGRQPEPGLWAYVDSVYAGAPVLNSDGSAGVKLHIDHGQGGAGGTDGSEIPFYYGIYYRGGVCNYDAASGRECIGFFDLKSRYFNPLKLRYVRYCIFANELSASPNVSGQAEAEWSNDLIITTRNTPAIAHLYERIQIGTFLHEFGHTMGLHHGGSDQYRRKPNYNSVMNSSMISAGVDIDCDFYNTFAFTRYTYSHGMRKPLDETCLNEVEGICDHVPADFDQDGTATDRCLRHLLSEFDSEYTILLDQPDWPYFKYSFTAPGSLWEGD